MTIVVIESVTGNKVGAIGLPPIATMSEAGHILDGLNNLLDDLSLDGRLNRPLEAYVEYS